jgi:rubrerythrin
MTRRSERQQAAQVIVSLQTAVHTLADAGASLASILSVVQGFYDARMQTADEQMWRAMRASGMRDWHCEQCACSFLHRDDGTCPMCGAQAKPVS